VLFTDPVHHGVRVPTWGGGHPASTLADAKHMSMRALFVGDTMAGLWKFDLDTGSVVIGACSVLAPAVRERVEAAAADTDTVEQVRARAATVRALGA
jgi:hypothetical protein